MLCHVEIYNTFEIRFSCMLKKTLPASLCGWVFWLKMNSVGRGELEVQISSPYCIRRKRHCPGCVSSIPAGTECHKLMEATVKHSLLKIYLFLKSLTYFQITVQTILIKSGFFQQSRKFRVCSHLL